MTVWIKSGEIRFVAVGGGGEIGSLAEFPPEGIEFDLGQRPFAGILGDLGGVQGDAFASPIIVEVRPSVLVRPAPVGPVAGLLLYFQKVIDVVSEERVGGSVKSGRPRRCAGRGTPCRRL